jgi:pimeloyl-ACP methyl ester carboxylesterase
MDARIISTALGPLECAVYGEGPAVLALHGALGGYDQSFLLARAACGALRARYVCVSRPGYLGTPLGSFRSPARQADLCAALLDALGLNGAAVLAISGGGPAALQFALRHPARCRALALVSACSAPLRTRLPLRFHLIRAVAHFPPLVQRMRRKALANLDGTIARSIPHPDVRAATLAHAEAGPLLVELQSSLFEHLRERMPGTLNDIAETRRSFDWPVESITAPTLVIHGTDDPIVPFAQARALASRVPGAELLAIASGGHSSLFSHLEQIRARVARVLETRI